MTEEALKIGQVVEIEIIGLQDYGAFVRFNNDQKGLIHISEVKSGYVKSLAEIIKIGQKLKAQIIDIDEFNGKVSLSMRSLEDHPETHFSYHKKHFTDSRDKIGFKTLAKELGNWTEEGEKFLKKKL